MVYKVVFWNPINQIKRVYHFCVTWDSANHCWSLKTSNILFESERPLYEDPNSFIRFWAHNYVMPNEYITIKSV